MNVTFTPKLYNKPKDDGSLPIVILVSWRDQKSQSRRKRIGVSCLKEDFERGRIKPHIWRAQKTNNEIEEALTKANLIYREHFETEDWNYTEWSALFDKEDAHVTFDSFCNEVIEKYFKIGKAGTALYYRDNLKAIQKFMGKSVLEFQEINKALLKSFENDILSRGHKGDRTMRGLKSLFSKAVEDEIIDMKDMPFKTAYNPVGYKFSHLKRIKKESSLIKRLSQSQVKQILEFTPRNEGEEKAIDLWKFSYYTMGVNLKDIALLKESDIKDGLWYFNREKTGNTSFGKPLLEECLSIIDKYKGNKYVFDFILNNEDHDDRAIKNRVRDASSNLRRRYIKISKELKFDGHFSFYSARYTSATLSAKLGGDMRAIQNNMNHSSLTTTEIYSQYSDVEAMKRSLELLRPE